MTPTSVEPDSNTLHLLIQRKGIAMSDLMNADTTNKDELLLIDLGDAAELTEGQGQGSSEDKRRAYNS